MEFKLKSEDVRREAEGRWGYILSNLAPSLSHALSRAGKHVDCPHPGHGGKNDFRMFKDYELTGGGICTCGKWSDGFSLLMWINGWGFYETLKAVAHEVGMVVDDRPRKAVPRIDRAKIEEAKRKKAQEEAENNVRIRQILNRMWAEAYPASAPQAEPLRMYLARRGLSTTYIPETLRLHPSLPYRNRDGELMGRWPAIVALVQTADGTPITLHRIYLTTEGQKAPVDNPKKLMPYPTDKKLVGSAIRLGPAGAALGIAEGIETGLAVQQATGMPAWVTISATLLEGVDIPESVQQLCIYADKDRSETGRNSAAVLVQRMWKEGRQACGLLPTMAIPGAEKGIDWLDVLNRKGPQAIPNLARVKELLRAAVGGN